MEREGKVMGFLDPVARSSPISIPSGMSSSSVCAASPGGSSFWGSASSATFGAVQSGASLMQSHMEARTLKRKEVMALAEVEEAASSLFTSYSPASLPLVDINRKVIAEEAELEGDDESLINTSFMSGPHFSPLTSVESSMRFGSASMTKPRKTFHVTMYEIDSALRQIDIKLSYLGAAAKFRARKALSLLLEECTSSLEINRCMTMTSILADLEMDDTVLLAGAFNQLKVPKERIAFTFDDEAINLIDSFEQLHRKVMSTLVTKKLTDEELAETLDDLADPRLVALELASALVQWRSHASSGLLSFELGIKKLADLTLRFYAPLAHTAGFAILQRELEERAFEQNYPREYHKLKREVYAKTSQFVDALDASRKRLENVLWSDPDFRSKVSSLSITGRQKSLYSIWRKMQRKGLPLDEVYDVLALRVVITPRLEFLKSAYPSEDLACYRALELIHNNWSEYDGRRVKDYLASPKANGYRSLHTTVSTNSRGNALPLEIQIRSERMHRIAEIGSASHVNYKGEGVAKRRSSRGPGLPIPTHVHAGGKH